MKYSSNQLLRRYIREAIDLGKTQFSIDRVDKLDRFGEPVDKTESNTPEEQALYDELVKRIEVGKHLTQPTAAIILDLLDSKYGEQGSGFFVEPAPDTLLLRGNQFSKGWIEQHIPEEELGNLEIVRGYADLVQLARKSRVALKVPYRFEQLRGWSKSPEIAASFAIDYATRGDDYAEPEGFQKSNKKPQVDDHRIAVMMVTTPKDSGTRFLDLAASMYKTDRGKIRSYEQECINLGPVEVTEVAIGRTSKFIHSGY